MQKILLIGASMFRSAATVQTLEAAGYIIEHAATGSSGLELARAHNPNLVVCDWKLNDCDGHQVLKQMRSNLQLQVIPFILLSPLYSHQHLRQTMHLGADDCLLYPFSDEALIRAISARLKQQQAIANHYLSHLRLAAEHLNRLSYYDSLTKLPNHLLFEQRFTQLIQTTHQPVALLSLSLDRLRQVNNILGYPAGDSLLQSASHRLQACLPMDTMIARLTGNQFAIALSQIEQLTTVRKLCSRANGCPESTFLIAGA